MKPLTNLRFVKGNSGLFCLLVASLYILAPRMVSAIDNDECMDCHGSRDILEMSRSERLEMVRRVKGVKRVSPGVTSLFVDQGKYSGSVHGELECTDCHSDIEELPHRQYLAPVDCSECHPEVADQYRKSRHFKKSQKRCWQCHDPHSEPPIDELSHKQRVAICKRCHGTPVHEWLPQPETHFKYLECTVCHSPKAQKAMFLRFYVETGGKPVPVSYSQLAKALGPLDDDIFKVMDINGNGTLDPFEIKAVLNKLEEAGLGPCGLKEEILVTSPYHNFTDRVKNIKDCAMCHTSLSPFYKSVEIEVPDGKGRYKRFPVSREYLAKMPPIPNQHTYLKSVHAENGVTCLDCHSEFKVLNEMGRVKVKSPGIVVCANCHEEIMEQYKKSLHYRVSKKICYNCHNPHAVKPFTQLNAQQRRQICQKCHTDALKQHQWLSQPIVHFKYLECTMCHSPNATKGIIYYFRGITAEGRPVRLTYKDLSSILGKPDVDIAKFMDRAGSGRISALELSSFLDTLNKNVKRTRNLKYVDMGVYLVVLKPVHNFTDRGLKAKECVVCHSADAPFYSKVLLEIPEKSGGIETLPLDKSVLTGIHGIGGVSDFYLLGEHRLTKEDLEELWLTVKSIGYRWIDIIGVVIVLGGLGFVCIHTFFRLLTIKNRRARNGRSRDDVNKDD
ncbi:MAG: hypothetical protein GXO58_01980 [Thermodesulfobacteria bacterium]|nr:hypothetical protein [Thermodesulfobacteriota bacterium]